ncbi:Protein DA1 [Rhynchospora pubera]|uniref:Protein DA1 n=1 Tax=Rhynchospora pubera TaxID=906938 RepID=A0AAV8H3N6_9POAL|nr:Protein DA1 [Rhynchospora pubera]
MCHVCFKIISANRHGIIPVWNKKYCYSHETDGTPRCCGCGQLEPIDVEYVQLPDDRNLCFECLHSSTMNNIECQPLYMDIQEFFEGLEMGVEQQIPLLLVERDALNEAVKREKNHHHDSLTIGMCLCEAHVIRTVVSKPRTEKGRRISIITVPYQLEQHWHVTAILVLYGLPRLFTGSILAHELMHAWLRLNGYKGLEPEVEEGICQVMAHKWLESELLAGSGSSSFSEFERKLAEFHIRLIEKNPSRVYGGGFRATKAAVNRYGLRRTLEHIKRAGDLP